MAVAVEASERVINVAGCEIKVADVVDLMQMTGMEAKDAIAALYNVNNASEEKDKVGVIIPIEEPQYNFENKPWSQEEVNILVDNVLDIGYSGVAEMLPNRTYRAVVQKGRTLGLSIGKERKYQKWSQVEIDFMLQYRDRFTYDELGALLGRTWRAVMHQWHRNT
jgi:hypothetical protein